MLSSHGYCVRSADTALGEQSEIKFRTEVRCASVWSARMPGAEPDTKWVHRATCGPLYLENRMNVSVACLLRVVWEGVKGRGGEWHRSCVIRPRRGTMRVGEGAAVCYVTLYVCACTYYGLLDVADACRSRHFTIT